MIDPLALLMGVNIGSVVSYIQAEAGSEAKNAIKSAVKKKLSQYWESHKHRGKELLTRDLQIALRTSYLKAVFAVSTDCEACYSSVTLNPTRIWTQSINRAVRFELGQIKKPNYIFPPTLANAQLPALLQPFGEHSAVDELEEALLAELKQEFAVVLKSDATVGSVFMRRLHAVMAEADYLGHECPPELWSMFAEGWPCSSALSVAKNSLVEPKQDGRLYWLDLVTAYFSDYLRQDAPARISFENHILSHIALREGSISTDSIDKALEAFSRPLKYQLDELRSLMEKNSETEEANKTISLQNANKLEQIKSQLADFYSEATDVGHSTLDQTLKNVDKLEQIKSQLADFRSEATDVSRSTFELVKAHDEIFRELFLRLVDLGEKPRPAPDTRGVSAQDDLVLQGYLEWIVREFSNLPSGLNLNSELIPLPLDKVYVSVRGYPGTVTELQQNDFLASGKTPASLRKRDQRRQFADGTAPSIDLSRAFRENQTMVILGDPGSGKTTLSRWLALNFARSMLPPHAAEVFVPLSSVKSDDEIGTEQVSLGDTRLPIFLRAANVAEAIQNLGKGTSLAQVLAYSPTNTRPVYPVGHPLKRTPIDQGVLNALFLRYIEGGRAIILVDGLDEVQNPADREQIVSLVHEFIDLYFGSGPGNQLLVTSRIVGYELNPLRNTVARYTVEPMNPTAIRAFSKGWHSAWSVNLRDMSSESQREAALRASDNLLSQIFDRDAGSLEEIASNPLMLSLLCTLNLEQDQKLPDSRAELYAALVNRELHESWLRRDRSRERLRDPLIRILARLAEYLHATTSTGLIDRSSLETKAKEFAKLYPQIEAVGGSVEELVAVLLEGAGLIVQRGFHQYGFPHQTIQEYLAGLALAENPSTTVTSILQRAHDSRWREVLLFTLGILATLDQGQRLENTARAMLAKDDDSGELLPVIGLLLAGAMAQIPSFPVAVGRLVLTRLFVRYSSLSLGTRQAGFCELVEEVFGREAKWQKSSARRETAVSVLREYAASGNLANQQAAAVVAANRNLIDAPLFEILARAARHDSDRGGWRIRFSLVTALSRKLREFNHLQSADSSLLSALDQPTLLLLRDSAFVTGSRYTPPLPTDTLTPATLPIDLFPLRQYLLRDQEILDFLRSSPGWLRVVISLHGGLCLLGLSDQEQDLANSRRRLAFARTEAEVFSIGLYLDSRIEPSIELLRSVPLAFDPALIWRGSPLSAWLTERLQSRVAEPQLIEDLLQLWNNPDSYVAQHVLHDFEVDWERTSSSPSDLATTIRTSLLTEVLLALAALGAIPEKSSLKTPRPEVYEAFRLECDWLNTYLREPAYRSMLALEKSLNALNTSRYVTVKSGLRPASTARAVQVAFGANASSEQPNFPKPLVGVLWRLFVNKSHDPADKPIIDSATEKDFLEALLLAAAPAYVPWQPEQDLEWLSPCIPSRTANGTVISLLAAIRRVPDSHDSLRSYALRLVGRITDEKSLLLPVAVRLTKDWDTAAELFRSAMEPWLDVIPTSDDEWKAVRKTDRKVLDPAKPFLSFWALRLTEPTEATARRSWLSLLYDLAKKISDLPVRLAAELQIFSICDADETVSQLRRMLALVNTLEDAAARTTWTMLLEALRPLTAATDWSSSPDPRYAAESLALASFGSFAASRQIKAYDPIYNFNKERPYILAILWSHLLSNESDDPVYSCAVTLDTLGRVLAADLDDLIFSLVWLDSWIGLPFGREWVVLPTTSSKERRRDSLLTALLVLCKIPQSYHMLVEWCLRRIHPYLTRLDREFIPLAIVVASRLQETNRASVLQLLYPASEGDLQIAIETAWQSLAEIPDPYLRWRTEWALSTIGTRRRPPTAMLEDLKSVTNPEERFICMVLFLIDGRDEPARVADTWNFLASSLSQIQLQTIRDLHTPEGANVDEEILYGAGLTDRQAGLYSALEKTLSWLAQKQTSESPEAQRLAAAIADLRVRIQLLNLSDAGAGAENTGFWRCVSEGKTIEDSSIPPDPVTGLKFVLLDGAHVGTLSEALPAGDRKATLCPQFLQFIQGASPDAVPFLQTLASSRQDICGDWAALMLAEIAVWTKPVVRRTRALLTCGDTVLRNRAILAFARGGELRDPESKTSLLSSSKLGPDVIEEMASSLVRIGRFHPLVDMTMIFVLDRVNFDDLAQHEAWLEQSQQNTPAGELARTILGSISHATLPVCRKLAEQIPTVTPKTRSKLIRSAIYLWERKNWLQERTVWPLIRKNLLQLGESEGVENAADALEALGYVGLADHGPELLRIAAEMPAKQAPVLRAFGIASGNGLVLSPEEKAFLLQNLTSHDNDTAVAATEAALRSGITINNLEARMLPTDRILDGLISRLSSYFIGGDFVRKVHESGAWLNQVTHDERRTSKCSLPKAAFGRLLRRISEQIASQSFTDSRRYMRSERLSSMLAIAAAAAEHMPEGSKALLIHMEPYFTDQLQSVVEKHESYVARQAALVLLSMRRQFSCAFASALTSALGDLSILQTTAIDCVSRIEEFDTKTPTEEQSGNEGLAELEKLLLSPNPVVTFAATRIVQQIAAASDLSPALRSQFEMRVTQILQSELNAYSGVSRPAFAIDSSLENWTYRWVFLGWLQVACEDALFSVRYPSSAKKSPTAPDGSERVEVDVQGIRGKDKVKITLNFGSRTAKSKHPAMHQSNWQSTVRGQSVASEVMEALEKVQKLHHELGVSFARLLHLAIQSRTTTSVNTETIKAA